MIIKTSSRRCGAGKTEYICNHVASTKGKFIIAVDRAQVLEARVARIRDKATLHGTEPTIDFVISPSAAHVPSFVRTTKSVAAGIAALPCTYRDAEHVIVFVTHEGLKLGDWSDFEGWTVFIDEVPAAWHSDKMQVTASLPSMRKNYKLKPVSEKGVVSEWRQVVAKPDAATVMEIHNDTNLRSLVPFHRRVESGLGVFINAKTWSDTKEGATWWSLWTPLELEAFDEVFIFGNSFYDSVTYKLWAAASDRMKFEEIDLGDAGEKWESRKVVVRYFANNHRGRTSLFASHPEIPKAWLRWVAEHSTAENHFYCVQGDYAKHAQSPAGLSLTPKTHGMNELRHITTCSILYMAKASRQDVALFREFGISEDEIIRSRELEDILQFLFRTSIRMPADPRDVEIRVYDRAQAEFLRDFIRSDANLSNVAVELTHTELFDDAGNSLDVVTEPKAAVVQVDKKAKDAERMRLKRLEDRMKKMQEGTYRGRGRPPKAA